MIETIDIVNLSLIVVGFATTLCVIIIQARINSKLYNHIRDLEDDHDRLQREVEELADEV